MNRLWAPWRLKYIQAVDTHDDGCIFCIKPKQNKDRENLILHRATNCFVIMNLYPYNNGHLMIVPYKHVSDPGDLDSDTLLEMMQTVNECTKALRDAMNPEGFNIGMNIGRVAGAGIDQHVHMHIVPRWNGDTNFMPVLGSAKVISQGLFEAYDMLKTRISG